MSPLGALVTLLVFSAGGASSFPSANAAERLFPAYDTGRPRQPSGWTEWGWEERAESQRVLDALDGLQAQCRRIDVTYRASCLYRGYAEIAKTIPRRSALAPVADSLTRTARTVRREVSASRDRRQPRIASPFTLSDTRRPDALDAVRADRVAETAALTSAVLRRESLILLRSVPESDPRAALFQRVALAFEESAVLLRS